MIIVHTKITSGLWLSPWRSRKGQSSSFRLSIVGNTWQLWYWGQAPWLHFIISDGKKATGYPWGQLLQLGWGGHWCSTWFCPWTFVVPHLCKWLAWCHQGWSETHCWWHKDLQKCLIIWWCSIPPVRLKNLRSTEVSHHLMMQHSSSHT